jgi:hypothetical protein
MRMAVDCLGPVRIYVGQGCADIWVQAQMPPSSVAVSHSGSAPGSRHRGSPACVTGQVLWQMQVVVGGFGVKSR